MSTDLPIARFCALCSLLCEPESVGGNFGASFCSRRNRELDAIREWSDHRDTLNSVSAWEPIFEESKTRLRRAGDFLITGRMRSVETSRSALRIAERYRALIDPWDSDDAFDSISAFQRVGGITVSLSEARNISELLIVIGGDSFLEDYPRLPAALCRGSSIPVLLLGDWSHAGCKPWLDAGFEVLAIDTPIEHIPRSLAEASACKSMAGWDSSASRWLSQSGYTSVIWSMKHLDVEQADLWYESMMLWLASENETRRIGAMCWSELDSTFHQVCTWRTGFPARIKFDESGPRYDPSYFTAQRWLDSYCINPSTTQSASSHAPPLVLWVDDSFDDLPSAVFGSGIQCIAISPRAPVNDSSALWLPCLPAGLGCDSEIFRGDHAILAYGRDPKIIAHELPSATQWLKGLIES